MVWHTSGVATYSFVKNIQGDILEIVDEQGVSIIKYTYDAWGNMTYTLNGIDEEYAKIFIEVCPLTYRGYVYDSSTGLYYLQSRYYNPQWGRFLNCDDTNILLATQGTDHGANLFAYCNNNPVNMVDYTGMTAQKQTDNVIVFGAIFSLLALVEGENNSDILEYDVYGVDYFYPLNSELLEYVIVLKKGKKYYSFYSMFGDKGEWEGFIHKRSYRIDDYLINMGNAHANCNDINLQYGVEGTAMTTYVFEGLYVGGVAYIIASDIPFSRHCEDAEEGMLAVTKLNKDTKSNADKKLKNRKIPNGIAIDYWYIW